MNDALPMIVVLLAGLGLAVVGGVLMVSQVTLRRRLRRMPRSRARNVRPGEFVKMVGRLTSRAPVLAPLANVDCVYYRMTVLERRDSEDSWSELSSERLYAEDWMLEDESGRIEVQPDDGVLEHIRLREYDPHSALPSDGVRRDVVMRYVPRSDGLLERPVRLREERLDQGSPVVLFGRILEGPRGPVLAGGHELEIYGETEQQLSAPQAVDVFSWVLVVGGVGMLVWGAGTVILARGESQAGEAVPIERSAVAAPPPVPFNNLKKSKSTSGVPPAFVAPPGPPPYTPNRRRRY